MGHYLGFEFLYGFFAKEYTMGVLVGLVYAFCIKLGKRNYIRLQFCLRTTRGTVTAFYFKFV